MHKHSDVVPNSQDEEMTRLIFESVSNVRFVTCQRSHRHMIAFYGASLLIMKGIID
jgi:hypothetical protein